MSDAAIMEYEAGLSREEAEESTNLPGESIRASSCSRLKITQATDVTFKKAQRVEVQASGEAERPTDDGVRTTRMR